MKKIVLLSLVTFSLFGLDINEAIERAMLNNPTLKEKKLLYKSAHEETQAQYSGYKPTLDLNYQYSRFSKTNYVGADSSSYANATLGYNLFNGFSDKFNIKSKEAYEKAASYLFQATKADLRLQVYLAYIQYLRAQEQIVVATDTIKLLQQQLNDAKNMYEQGLFAKNDYLQVDVELSTAKQALFTSQRDVKIAFYQLQRLLGTPLSMREPIAKIQREEKALLKDALHAKMLDNRSELKYLRSQNQAINYTYKASASNYYPKVDAKAKYELAGEDPLPDGGTNFNVHKQKTATVLMSWNLYAGDRDEANRAALLYQNQASNEQINALYLELDFQLEQALQEYQLARSQITVAKKALEQAKENFRITKDQFDANIANTTLMLDAQRFLARTQVEYYSAYFAMYDAMAQIERVVEEEIF